MITVTLQFMDIVTEHSFDTLTNALVFARSKEIGTSFFIKEGTTLLAKGKIEKYKEKF
jgi:hypothetical protein